MCTLWRARQREITLKIAQFAPSFMEGFSCVFKSSSRILLCLCYFVKNNELHWHSPGSTESNQQILCKYQNLFIEMGICCIQMLERFSVDLLQNLFLEFLFVREK